MEEMRQRIDRGDQSREVEENIQVSCSCRNASRMLISEPLGHVRYCQRPGEETTATSEHMTCPIGLNIPRCYGDPSKHPTKSGIALHFCLGSDTSLHWLLEYIVHPSPEDSV